MRLQFQNQKYLSIDQFDAIDLPDFVVLTGVNGSGKSHLLEAIEKRAVIFADMQNTNTVLFSYETFKLENESSFNAQQLSQEREAAWQFHQQRVKPNVHSYRQELEGNYDVLKKTCETSQKNLLSLSVDYLKNFGQNVKGLFASPDYKNNPQAQGIYTLAKNVPYSIDEIERDEFERLYKPFEYKNDFLPYQLGKIFWDYYVKYYRNRVNEFENIQHGKNLPFLNDEDFFKIHGEKPWDMINKILESFDTLKYRVNSPEGFDCFGSFQLKLKHIEIDNLEIEFSSLSSGEKVLMALVASVYKSTADKHFPDVLLLDEVDASLHPSMMKNMLAVIDEIFIKQGVKIILVTHSPTTIALAPEESIFVMNRSGRNRIEKKSRQEALSILTEGFATIEEGLRLFDEVAKSRLTIITEGKNTKLIAKALELFEIKDIEVLAGVEGASGTSQLKVLFDFLSKTTHKNKVIFVFDCDFTGKLTPENNTFSFTFAPNNENNLAKNGVENMFSEQLFEGYLTTITKSNGNVIKEFDGKRKNDFSDFIISRNHKNDFNNFLSLVERIKKISNMNITG